MALVLAGIAGAPAPLETCCGVCAVLRVRGSLIQRDQCVGCVLNLLVVFPSALVLDVLCQPPSAVADVGLPSSALRSALRPALRVTASPSIRWVAAVSGRGPTVRGSSPCSAVAGRGGGPGRTGCGPASSATRRGTRRGRGCGWRAGGRGRGRSRGRSGRRAQGCQWRVLSASVQNASRRRLLHAQRKQATLRLPDSTATAAWPASPASASRGGVAGAAVADLGQQRGGGDDAVAGRGTARGRSRRRGARGSAPGRSAARAS